MGYSYPADAGEYKKAEIFSGIVRSMYEIESIQRSPLHDLSEYDHFKNQFLVNSIQGVDLLSDGNNGIWTNKHVGIGAASFDIHFSKVEIARALNRDFG